MVICSCPTLLENVQSLQTGTGYRNNHPPSCFQDKAQPETQATSFGDVLFNAKLAVDDPEAILLVNQPGSDGFRVDSTPLFQVGVSGPTYGSYVTGKYLTLCLRHHIEK